MQVNVKAVVGVVRDGDDAKRGTHGHNARD